MKWIWNNNGLEFSIERVAFFFIVNDFSVLWPTYNVHRIGRALLDIAQRPSFWDIEVKIACVSFIFLTTKNYY